MASASGKWMVKVQVSNLLAVQYARDDATHTRNRKHVACKIKLLQAAIGLQTLPQSHSPRVSNSVETEIQNFEAVPF